MIDERNACQSCGMSPCFGCTELVYTCDKCGQEVMTLFDYGGGELCEDCLLEVSHNDCRVSRKKNNKCSIETCKKYTSLRCDGTPNEDEDLYDFQGEGCLCEEAFDDAIRGQTYTATF